MIRAVIDPGVLIAAVLSAEGAPAELLRLWLDGVFEIVVSEKLLSELRGVLARPKFRTYLSLSEAERYVSLLERWAERSADAAVVAPHTPDPKDDYLVELAISAKAAFIVSGDRHLTNLPDSKVPVLTPRRAVDLLSRLG